MERREILKSAGYWTQNIQLALYDAVNGFLNDNNMTRTEFANRLGVSKGYVSQVLNGEFDHKLSKLVELSLACDIVPVVSFVPMNEAEEAASSYKNACVGSPAPFLQTRMYTSAKKSLADSPYVVPQARLTPVNVA